MVVKFSRRFDKQYGRVEKSVKLAFEKRLKLFFRDQFHPLLCNHLLKGKLSGYRSISITGDWRVIFSEVLDSKGNQIVIFEMIGTHSQLYK